MGDQDPAPSLSRRTLLTGGIAAALTATAAGTLPVAEEDAAALRPFNYPSGGHGDWWPDYVAHAGTPKQHLPLPPAVGSRPGEGVAISLLDSGVVLDHSWFAGRVTGDAERADLDELGRLHCNAGHGTFVAGVLLTHAPGARVEVHRVFDNNWIVDDFAMAQRLRALASSDVQVLTMPFGGYSHDDLGMLATSAALRYLFDRRPDLVAVAGAGNDATNKPYFPAADRGVIAVGAVQRDASGRWRRACFSNYGPWVDASAPGVNVLSTFLHYEGPMVPREVLAQCIGRLGGEDRMPSGRFTGRAYWSGTSFAAPVVAAAIAAAIAEGRSGPDAARHVLLARDAPRMDNLGTIVAPRSRRWPDGHAFSAAVTRREVSGRVARAQVGERHDP
jgi:Subtilase family